MTEGKDQEEHREDQLHADFLRAFSCADLAEARMRRVAGVRFERRGQAGAEPVGIDQQVREFPHFGIAAAGGEVAQGVGARRVGLELQLQACVNSEASAGCVMRSPPAGIEDRGIQALARLNPEHHEVERRRQAVPQLLHAPPHQAQASTLSGNRYPNPAPHNRARAAAPESERPAMEAQAAATPSSNAETALIPRKIATAAGHRYPAATNWRRSSV